MAKPASKLLELLQDSSPAQQTLRAREVDLGLAEVEPFPFLAIVGQEEMKLALILAVINPLVGGVLLIGSRGTAKTTAVRALTDVLPARRRSLCPHGCTEEILAEEGMAGLCEDCARKVGYGEPLTMEDRVRMVELPLNARLEDVVGGINERIALEQQRVRLERGILAQADGNILYIDEVNLLDDAVGDAILDAAGQGFYTVRRGPLNLRYRSRFVLIGSMNPEEGRLRPQIMDRFGLRAVVRGLSDPEMRYRAYQQAISYRLHPERLSGAYAGQTLALAEEVNQAQQRLPGVTVGDVAREIGLKLIQQLGIDSGRAEIALFEAARAHAAADERDTTLPEDVQAVALIALRQRRSVALEEFFKAQEGEDTRLRSLLSENGPTPKKTRRRNVQQGT
ncbi:MAG: magnesium chelatase [Chloroflexi bacterium]|nr:magnesium chelatase [Chloroflexota bacterium]MCI0580330.1 magnesium chelatase [Chloroflexota bacterium]MCI0648523.1 magnesium chelatase [Chloroflexota bacterium]MCI0728497.1 magnesium chelatase [Chloroflexota bacterium]